ncbi:MAG: phosphomannose isomerase type II C-terminal cupin domain [Thermoproteota archaeon]|nr:phosphomannose isomerase type II C-terminal cupin domain [Thermoproteota archaeon]
MNIYSELRPWGRFEKFSENKPCTVKLLYINQGSRLSLQYHNKRNEMWKIIKGKAFVQVQDKELHLKEGEDVVIPSGAKHRVRAEDSDCVILELSFGEFDEGDIVRIEDDYKRT